MLLSTSSFDDVSVGLVVMLFRFAGAAAESMKPVVRGCCDVCGKQERRPMERDGHKGEKKELPSVSTSIMTIP